MCAQLLPNITTSLPLVILGDFNFDLFKDEKVFLKFMLDYFDCHQHIHEATTTSGSILDLVFANINISCNAICCAWSDHKTIYAVV